MRVALIAVLLAGCASQDYVASRSNYDVCRLSMGGPHAAYADAEAAKRGLDCRQYYPAITANEAQRNAAVQQLLRANRPALTCQTMPSGIGTRTVCN